MQLPDSFIQDMKELLGTEYDSYIESYEKPRWYGLRVNTSKISVSDFLEISPFKLTPIPWIENGFYYDGTSDKPGKHPYYFAGLYYLQEPSAMTPANRLPVNKHDKVLDLCAAPGGKTTELASKLQGTGLLVANDISNSRARVLLKNLELFGMGNICVMSENPEKMIGNFYEYFDKILVDAPCSGEGMFRKDEKMVKSWIENGPEVYCEIQKKLILEAAQMLKPGGYLLYSTCTFNYEENEGTILYLMQEYPEFKVEKISPYEGFRAGNSPLESTVRIWPQHMKGEGHYLALLRKSNDNGLKFNDNTIIHSDRKSENKNTWSKKFPIDMIEFWKNITWTFDESQLFILGEKVYYLPVPMPNLNKLRKIGRAHV